MNFSVSDLSGNTARTTAEFTFVDTINPTITRNATDIVIEVSDDNASTTQSGWLQAHGGATAIDDSTKELHWSHPELSYQSLTDNSTCVDRRALVRFSATDDCGNQAYSTASITLRDRTAPVISRQASNANIQPSSSSEAELEAWIGLHGGASAVDDTTDYLTWTSSEPEIVEVSRISAPNLPGVGSGSGDSLDDSEHEMCLNRTVFVTFTVTDDCGNSNSTTAGLSITDTAKPTFVLPPQDLTIDSADQDHEDKFSNWLERHADAQVSDASVLSWTNRVGQISHFDLTQRCSDTMVEVNFLVADECGNFNSAKASFSRRDTFAPQMDMLPQDLVVEADGLGNTGELNAWLNAYGHASAIDNADLSSVLQWTRNVMPFVRAHPETSDLTGTAAVIFTVADACGNENSSSANFVIRDTTPPIMSKNPMSRTVEANEDGNLGELGRWLDTHGGGEATDASGVVHWTASETSRESFRLADLTSPCQNEEIVTTFTASDPSNNSVSAEATFTIVDTTPPHITEPPHDVSFQASGESDTRATVLAWLDNVGNAEVSDTRGTVQWSNNASDYPTFTRHNETSACTNRSAVVRFTAADPCDNTNSAEATITIFDTSPPALTSTAQPLTVVSDGSGNRDELSTWLESHGGASAEDNDFGALVWVHSDVSFSELIVGDGCTDRASNVMFTVSDVCGNSVSTSATFTIVDNEPPVLVTPSSNVSVSPLGGIVAVANSVVADLNNDNSHALQAWIDARGGAVVQDTVSQTLTWTHTVGDVQFVAPGSACTDKFVESAFTATDSCGHSTTTVGRFSIVDGTGPEIITEAVSASAEMNSEQQQSMLNAWLSRNGNAAAVDGSSSTSIQWSHSPLIFNQRDNRTTCTDLVAVVAFTASDACGNEATTTAEYALVDSSPPQITSGATSQIFEADSTTDNTEDIQGWLDAHGGAEAVDSTSHTLIWSYPDTIDWVTERAGCANRQATVMFTVADLCGNTVTTSATVAVVDSAAPVVTVPARNQSVLADGVGNVNDLQSWLQLRGDAVTSKPVMWTFDAPIFDHVTCAGRSAAVEFRATDACGATTSTTGHFHIVEVKPPKFATEGQDLTVEADWTDNAADLQSWLDAHGGATLEASESSSVTWTFTVSDAVADSINVSGACPSAKHRTATFTATDQCGQSVTTTARFVIRDTTPPVVGCNSNFEMRCDARCQQNTAFDEFLTYDGHLCISDVSSYSVSHNFPRDQFPVFETDVCGTSGSVTFTVTDNCGNIHHETVEYVVSDDTPECSACSAGEILAEVSTIEFMWTPAANSGTSVEIGVGTASANAASIVDATAQLSRGSVFSTTIQAGTSDLHLMVDGTAVVVDVTCSGSVSVGAEIPVGTLGLVGSLKVVGFVLQDGSSSDRCGTTDKCDPGLCLDIDACIDGPASLTHLTMMYVGYNPVPLSSDLYSQPESSVSIVGDPAGKSPVMMYFSKFSDEQFPGVDLTSVHIGQELTMHRFLKNADDAETRFTGFVNLRIDSASEKVKFITTCRDNNGLRVGDRFGSLLVTGYKTERGKQCHISYNPVDYQPDSQGSSRNAVADGGDGDSSNGVAFAVLGVGFAMVALVVIVAAVVLNKRGRSGRYLWDDAGSEASSRTGFSHASAYSRRPLGLPATAMDLMNSHHFSDAGSLSDAQSIGTSAFGDFATNNADFVPRESLQWDDATHSLDGFSEPALSTRNLSVPVSEEFALSSARSSFVESERLSQGSRSDTVIVAMDV